MGADVVVLDINHRRLSYLDDIFGRTIQTLFSNQFNIENCLRESDVLIGAVLVPGEKAPQIVSREQLSLMKPGSVIVDVAVDQGGCFETSRPTTHDNPIYKIDDVVHYCVSNMPGAVALTSTIALTNQTLVYGLKLADYGLKHAIEHDDSALKRGVNLCDGALTNKAVAASLEIEYSELLL